MAATKTQELDKQKAIKAVNNFLDHFINCCKQKQVPTANNFEHILSHDVQNTSNGKLVGVNIHDFIRHLQEIQKKYSYVECDHLQDCLISGNKCIIHYNMTLNEKDGHQRLLNVMAIVTFGGNEITHWTQVSHDKDKDHLNS